MPRHVRGDAVGDPTAVEHVGSVLRNCPQGAREIGLYEPLTPDVWRAVRLEKVAGRALELQQALRLAGEAAGFLGRQCEARLRERDGGLHELRPGQTAVLGVRPGERGDGTRNPDGRVAVEILVALGRARCADGHLGRTVYTHEPPLRRPDQHLGASSQAGHGGLDDRERERGGDRGVHGVATLLQHGDADVGGQGRAAHHHAVARLRQLIRRVCRVCGRRGVAREQRERRRESRDGVAHPHG